MSGSIKAALQGSVKEALRAQDMSRARVLRMILSKLKQVEVDERIELDEGRELAVLDKMQKERREAMAQFQANGRQDLVDQEQQELEVIQSFMPSPLSDEEVQTLISWAIQESQATGISSMGKVMALLRPKIQGRTDVSVVASQVKTILSQI